MNFTDVDYTLGALLRLARATRHPRLEVDIIKNLAVPKELLSIGISESIDRHARYFPELVVSTGSSMGFVKSAFMFIEFDLETSRPYHGYQQIIENPFVCEVTIVDDRNKEYKYRHTGWWYPEA